MIAADGCVSWSMQVSGRHCPAHACRAHLSCTVAQRCESCMPSAHSLTAGMAVQCSHAEDRNNMHTTSMSSMFAITQHSDVMLRHLAAAGGCCERLCTLAAAAGI